MEKKLSEYQKMQDLDMKEFIDYVHHLLDPFLDKRLYACFTEITLTEPFDFNTSWLVIIAKIKKESDLFTDTDFKGLADFFNRAIWADLHVYHYAIREAQFSDPDDVNTLALIDIFKSKMKFYQQQNDLVLYLDSSTLDYLKELQTHLK